MANYLLDNKDALKKEITAIENLQHAYEQACVCTHDNSREAINAYHSWYNKTVAVCNSAFGSDNPEVREFRAVDNSGNGHALKRNFHALGGCYAILMDNLKMNLQTDTDNVIQANSVVSTESHTPLIFISHAGNDSSIIKVFIDWILKHFIGLRDENIVCTSFEANTLQVGSDIQQYIKDKIESADIVLSMVSQNYKNSEVCMNEVGAAWALQKTIMQIVLPDSDFASLGWLLETRKAVKITNLSSISLFVESLCDKISWPQPKLSSWQSSSVEYAAKLEQLLHEEQLLKSQRESDNVYLTFEDGAKELDVTVRLKVSHYVESRPIYQAADNNELLNDVILKGSTLSAAMAIPEMIKPENFKVCSFNRKNESLAKINLLLVNNSNQLRDVHVILRGEGLGFKDSCTESDLIITNITKPVGIHDNYCDFSLGKCNPEMVMHIPEFFMEFNELYKEYGVYEFNETSNEDFLLSYVVSTADKKYEGSLKLHVKPMFETEHIVNNDKAGRSCVKAFMVDE